MASERELRQQEAAARRAEEQMERAAPPSVLGDTEDAVAEEVGGELTSWMPPGQGAGEDDPAEAP